MTTTTTTAVPMVYFGKIPARGDFVRSDQQPSLIRTLDRWLTQGIDLMAGDAGWKETYDRVEPLHFAFLGLRSRGAFAGHLLASADASGRRFPFVAGGGFEAVVPEDFVIRSPVILARPWRVYEQAALEAHATDDANHVLGQLAQTRVEVDVGQQAYEASCRDFAELHSLGSLQALLDHAGHRVDLRLTLMALGLLLQPVRDSGSSQLDRGLKLPLPADVLQQAYVASWWLALVVRFLRHADFELALFVAHAGGRAPQLMLGFSGGSPTVLHAALDPRAGAQVFVDLSEADWAEEPSRQDASLQRLSRSLEQPALSLKRAQALFRDTFLGE